MEWFGHVLHFRDSVFPEYARIGSYLRLLAFRCSQSSRVETAEFTIRIGHSGLRFTINDVIFTSGANDMGWTVEEVALMRVRKRNGREAEFDRARIENALKKAFRCELNLAVGQPLPGDLYQDILGIVEQVIELVTDPKRSSLLQVEEIQDLVEIGLMQRQHFKVARRYILYRSEHAKLRAVRHEEPAISDDAISSATAVPQVEIEPGVLVRFDAIRLKRFLNSLAESKSTIVEIDELVDEVIKGSFQGMTTADIARSLVLSARSRIEIDPDYDKLAAALQLAVVYRQSLGCSQVHDSFAANYRDRFEHYIIEGIQQKRLSSDLRNYDLTRLAAALQFERDKNFKYLGVQTIYDRYLLHVNGRRIETPQYFWMRVAMGLALAESPESRTEQAIEFYELLSSFRYTSATPTLFNSGTCHPQLSSCYLTTVQDDLGHIFKSIGDNAQLSKWAGGLGNDWTNVRAIGSRIHGTNGESQGVIPFLKIVNDAAVAVNQGGKRKGAVCAYLEPWHLDFEEFLDLRKNTGDDRRRTHDMHTAAWIPDLFMQRVRKGEMWTFFCPSEVPDLHDLYGEDFCERYEHYESLAAVGKLRQYRRILAVDLWRKLLTRLFETGHPWVTFKDPSNIRSPQDHAGVVHSSNLCTEILLNTSEMETAVCNLGSVNLARHIENGSLDLKQLEHTVTVAMRMLDNVVDINYYPTSEAAHSNTQHRPVGLGVMGFQDALHILGLPYASEAAMEFADQSMEVISYFAILASSGLAEKRGRYASYDGSKWSRGILPIDSLLLLDDSRKETIDLPRTSSLDWKLVRDSIAKNGMRNSNCLAIAPTATISTIVGASQSIEPTYKYLYAKSNLSGDFVQINDFLVQSLKARGLWNADLLDDLKYHDGSLADVQSIPSDLKDLYATAFEIEPRWLIEAAARRQKWIDQGQSLNLYLAKPNGKAIDAMYQLAWQKGLKTTYYMRSLAATQVEKSTLDVNRHGIQPKWMKSKSESSAIQLNRVDTSAIPKACSVNDPDCEACQ